MKHDIFVWKHRFLAGSKQKKFVGKACRLFLGLATKALAED